MSNQPEVSTAKEMHEASTTKKMDEANTTKKMDEANESMNVGDARPRRQPSKSSCKLTLRLSKGPRQPLKQKTDSEKLAQAARMAFIIQQTKTISLPDVDTATPPDSDKVKKSIKTIINLRREADRNYPYRMRFKRTVKGYEEDGNIYQLRKSPRCIRGVWLKKECGKRRRRNRERVRSPSPLSQEVIFNEIDDFQIYEDPMESEDVEMVDSCWDPNAE